MSAMSHQWSRRRFLESASVMSAAIVPSFGIGLAGLQAPQVPPARKLPAIEEAIVHEFVWRGHFDLDGIKRLLKTQPTLLNATFDWGSGDFEMAIGAAGHMGRRDIAEFLLGEGARMDIFVAAMLGRLDIVTATLAAYPSLANSKGPHGFTLVHHAEKGGDAASQVLAHLKGLGLK